MKGKWAFWSLALAFLFLDSKSMAQSFNYYGAYGLYPQGATRIMAMGGAFTGLSDEVSGMTYNPAGTVLANWWGDLGGNYSLVTNQEADLDGDGVKDGVAYGYLYYAGALHFGHWAFGVGLSSPYAIDAKYNDNLGGFANSREVKLFIVSLDIMLAYALSENWALGITLHGETMAEQYILNSANPSNPHIDASTTKTQSPSTVGVMFKPDKVWEMGATYTPSVQFNVDSSINNLLDNGAKWFKSVYIPEKTSVGISWSPSKSWVFVLDADLYGHCNDCAYVGSNLFPSYGTALYDPSLKYLFHGGGEWNFYDSRMWDFYLRLGAYSEPPQVIGGAYRSHGTSGFAMRYWIIEFSVSNDTASNFSNTTGGIGISLKPYL